MTFHIQIREILRPIIHVICLSLRSAQNLHFAAPSPLLSLINFDYMIGLTDDDFMMANETIWSLQYVGRDIISNIRTLTGVLLQLVASRPMRQLSF